MSPQTTAPDLARVLATLRQPIAPEELHFRAGGGGVLAYITARTVQDRLDAVAPDWSASFSVVSLTPTEAVVECHLTIAGVTRSDVGTGNGPEAVKSAYSDSLKRAAVHFGVGRCIYDWRPPRVSVKGGIDGRVIADLRAAYSSWLAKTGEAKYGPVLTLDTPGACAGMFASTCCTPAGVTGYGTHVDDALRVGGAPVPTLEDVRAAASELHGAGRSWENITALLAARGLDLTDAESWTEDNRSTALATIVAASLAGGA